MGALKRFFFTLLTLGIVLTLAVIGTVWALNNFTGTGPVTARCTATAGELGSHTLAPAQADSAALITAISQQRELPARAATIGIATRSEEHTSELQSRGHLVCRLLLEKKKKQSLKL